MDSTHDRTLTLIVPIRYIFKDNWYIIMINGVNAIINKLVKDLHL